MPLDTTLALQLLRVVFRKAFILLLIASGLWWCMVDRTSLKDAVSFLWVTHDVHPLYISKWNISSIGVIQKKPITSPGVQLNPFFLFIFFLFVQYLRSSLTHCRNRLRCMQDSSPLLHMSSVYTSCNVRPPEWKVTWRWMQWRSICGSPKDVLMLQNKIAVGYQWYWPCVWPEGQLVVSECGTAGVEKYTRRPPIINDFQTEQSNYPAGCLKSWFECHLVCGVNCGWILQVWKGISIRCLVN